MIIREVVCWYYKINEQIENQKKTNRLLQDILTTLNQQNNSANDKSEVNNFNNTFEVSLIDLYDFDFDHAISSAKDCKEGNNVDWRVPTKEEMIYIFNNKHKYRVFKDDKYWSSSRTKSGAFVLDFSNGSEDIYRLSNLYNVFFVRGKL